MEGRRNRLTWLCRAAALLTAVLLCFSAALADTAGKSAKQDVKDPYADNPCVSRGDDPYHDHIPLDWASYTPLTHSAHCTYPGCTRWVRIKCTLLPVETGEGEFMVCPVCGTVYQNGHPTAYTLSPAQNLTVSDSINRARVYPGRMIVLVGQVADAAVLTTCYEIYGSVRENSATVSVRLGTPDADAIVELPLHALAGMTSRDFSLRQEGDVSVQMTLTSSPAAYLVFRDREAQH